MNDFLKTVRRFFRKKERKGFTLIEVLFSIVLMSGALSAILLSMSGQISQITASSQELEASALAEEGIEAARSIRDGDWEALAVGTHGLEFTAGTWLFSGSSDTFNDFTREVTVTEISTNERQVDVDVTWEGRNGQTRNYELSTVLGNWRNLEESELGGTLDGDWHDPTFINNLIDFGPGFRGIAVEVHGNYLYMAGHGSVTQADELAIVDVSDPFNAFIRGSINIGYGINEVAVTDDLQYAFVAYADKDAQLQVVDVSNVDNPVLVKSFKISGNRNKGRSLDLLGDTLYFGTEGPDGNEFYVIDVSNPLNPIVLDGVQIGNDVNDVMVGGGYAFLAADPQDREVSIVNVQDPDNIYVEAFVDLPAGNDAEGVYYMPETNQLFVGRKMSSEDNSPEIIILDLTDPSDPEIVGSMEYDVDINSMYAEGNLMFVTALGDMEFKVYDISDLPDIGYYGGLDFGDTDSPTDIYYENNTFYISVFNNYALRIITAY